MTLTGKKKKMILPVMLINIGVIATSLILGCVSWFSLTNKFNPVDLRSSVLTSYFDSRDTSHPSDGSAENPFLITKPQHLYNLIGLHKSEKLFSVEGTEIMFWEAGFYFEFGKDAFDVNGHEIAVYGTAGDGDKEFYSYDDNGVLIESTQSNYLNMNYYAGENALSPIGTASHPFTGHIIGNNLTVTNLHITGIGCADIGIFGYVSEEATIENLYFDGIDIDVRQVNLDEYNSIYHNDIHTKANVGYIAGHVKSNESFQDVYVNNCKIRNSQGTQVGINNDYGYFGATDYGLGNPVATGDGFSYSYNPDKTYEYFETNYNSIKNSSLVLRNDFYPATGTFGTSVSNGSSGGNHYTLEGSIGDSTADHNYALSKIGFEEGDAVQNVWVKHGAASYVSPNRNTRVMDDEPVVTGNYAYYDGQAWNYYENTPNETEVGANYLANTIFFTTTRPDLTREIWTWYWSGSYPKRYLRHNRNGGKGVSDDVQYDSNNGIYLACLDYPGQSDNRDNDYIHGNYIRSDVNRTVYIVDFRAESRPVKYLYVANNNNKTLKWGEYQDAVGENSLGCAFHMNGALGAVVSLKVGNQKYVLCWESNEIRAKLEGTGSPAYFCLGGAGCNDTSLKADSFNMVKSTSDLRDGDEVTFAYGLNPQNGGVEVISAKQGTYNRKGIPNQVTNSGGVAQMMDNTEYAHFTLKKNTSDNTWSFYDEENDGYLSATSSFSDTLQLGEYFNNNSHFSLTFNSSTGAATLMATGTSTHNKLRYDVENAVFNCFEDGKQPVYIFKRVNKGLRDRVFDVQGCNYGTYGNFGGVLQNISPMYWSTPGESALTNYHRFVESPDEIGDINFNSDGYESSAIVEMSVGGGGGGEETWARCMDIGDLTVGAEYIIATYNNTFCGTAGPMNANGYMSEVTGTTFGSNGKVIVDPDPQANIFILREGDDPDTYLFESGGQYLGTTGMGQMNLSGDGDTNWTISFASNFYVDIRSTEYTNSHIAYGFATTDGTNLPNRFTTMQQGKDILLYKKTNEMERGTFVADEISATLDPNWNCDVIDVCGNASFYEDGLVLSPTTSFRSVMQSEVNHVAMGSTGSHFYNNYCTSDALTIKVTNVGSLDFGTVTIYGEGESPVFMKGTNSDHDGEYIAFDDTSIRCENQSTVQGKFQYTLSLNVYNIYNLSYCALDNGGNILSAYDTTGGMNAPDQDDFIGFDTKDTNDNRILKNFVLALGNTGDDNCKITKVEYSYNAAVGNMINFGKVGYRSAIYEGGETDGLGNNVKRDSLVTGPVMNFEYELPSGGAYMLIGVEYTFDSAYQKYVYSITIKCSVAITVYIFNYDAQRELVKINGTLRPGAYTPYAVTAVDPPIGGWTK